MKIQADLLERLRTAVTEILPLVVAIRHKLHQCPEIASCEYQTSHLIRTELANTTFETKPPLLDTDVVAEIKGKHDTVICLRADIDALPIEEQTGLSYSSMNAGMMHACGHDGHTAILLGTAMVLDKLQSELPVSVRLLFQPGEEVACMGRDFVEAGACDGAEAAYALHGWAGAPTGTVSSRPGPFFAAAAMFDITLTGKGCHGAMPAKGISPLPGLAELITRLQEFHETVHQETEAIVTPCMVGGGQSPNIIPENCKVRGTARYFDEATGQRIEQELRSIAADVAAQHKLTATVMYDACYGLPVINAKVDFHRIRDIATQLLKKEAWQVAPAPTTGAEDFAYYLEGRHGAMFWLGQGEECAPLHSAHFDFNDDSIFNGIMMMSLLALTYEAQSV